MRGQEKQRPPVYKAGEKGVDWESPRSVKNAIETHLWLIGMDHGMEKPLELVKILQTLSPGEDRSYLELDTLRVLCESLLELQINIEIRRDTATLIGLIRAFDAGITHATLPISEDGDEGFFGSRRGLIEPLR